MSQKTFRHQVLIVEDELLLRLLGKITLEAQGYEVHFAEDGLQGLAVLQSMRPDLIISDLQMPNMNGFEFLAIVRQRFPSVPVIVVSGEFSGASVPDSVLADAYFPKGNYQPAALFAKISQFLAEPPRPSVAD